MEKKSVSKRIEIDLRFDRKIACDKDLSNKQFAFQIGGLDGTIAFPKINLDVNRDNYSSNNSILPPDGADLQIFRHEEMNWGRLYSFPFNCVHIENLRAWVNVLDEDNYENEGNFLQQNLPKWRDLLQQYVEIFTKIGLRHRLPEQYPLNRHIDMAIWKNNGGRVVAGRPFNRMPVLEIVIGDMHPCLDEQSFLFILDKLKTFEAPPLEYQFLNEARVDNENGNFGKAVLQASTSIEIVLERKIIETNDQGTTKPIPTDQTLGKKYDLVKSIGINLSTFNYTKEFVKVRNSTVHRGYSPSEAETNGIIKAAEKILEHFSPLM